MGTGARTESPEKGGACKVSRAAPKSESRADVLKTKQYVIYYLIGSVNKRVWRNGKLCKLCMGRVTAWVQSHLGLLFAKHGSFLFTLIQCSKTLGYFLGGLQRII